MTKIIDLTKLTENEISELIFDLKFGMPKKDGITGSERKKLFNRIRARDEKRVLAGTMTLAAYNSRWPLNFEGRTPADADKLEADRKARLTQKAPKNE